MSVRTSTVVALGLGLLAVVGVGTIFGESIATLWAPVVTEAPSKSASSAGPARTAAATGSAATLPSPTRNDAGAAPSPDSSS